MTKQSHSHVEAVMLRDFLFPACIQNTELKVKRLSEHEREYHEMKDPNAVLQPDNSIMLYCSIGNSRTQRWKIGRFHAQYLSGPYKELESAEINGLSGPEVCAPAVIIEENNDKPLWSMYVQSSCFAEDCVIALATSHDGQHFKAKAKPVITKSHLEQGVHPIVGVYDAGISTIEINNTTLLCLLFSGYRRVGCGNIFMTYREKNSRNTDWKIAQRILAQEDVPFHNNPSYEHFEWGPEGAKITQLSEDCFLLIGVCFLPRPKEFQGKRQRVFFAISSSFSGPYLPLGSPFAPQMIGNESGEHGHPDTMILPEGLGIVYQERYGEGQPWHLRFALYDIAQLRYYLHYCLQHVDDANNTIPHLS